MKTLIPAAILLSLAASPALVAAGTPCKDVQAQIAAKLDAKGVKNYNLAAVANAEVKAEDKVVGSCEGGKMMIVYTRGGTMAAKDAAAAPAAAAPAAPAAAAPAK